MCEKLHDAEQRCSVLQQLAVHRDASLSDMQQQLKVLCGHECRVHIDAKTIARPPPHYR